MYYQNKFFTFLITLGTSLSFLTSLSLTQSFLSNYWSSMTIIVMWSLHLSCLHFSSIFNYYQHPTLIRLIKDTCSFAGLYLILTLIWFFIDQTPTFTSTSLLLFLLINSLFTIISSGILYVLLNQISLCPTNYNSVLLVTTLNHLSQLGKSLTPKKQFAKTISTILIVDQTSGPLEIDLSDFPDAKLIYMSDLEHTLIHDIIDEAFIYLDSDLNLVTLGLLKLFEQTGLDIYLNVSLPHTPKGLNINYQIEPFFDHLTLKYSSKFYNPTAVFCKRVLDILGACVGLILTFLVGLILVPLIKLDSKGPAIFVQNRIGRNGRVFKFYKFRSMVDNAESLKEELLTQNESQGHMFKMTDDPRVTRVGKFIRKTSLDELPQFFNVLIGDMSLVGTRPPTEEEFYHYTPQQKKRLSIKPGITGLWQVSGRSNIKDFNQVVELDIQYIENWSFLLDIKILLKTVKIIFSRHGAR